ncbi:hypothetical protein BCIN_08g02320 [Botrytis cinerea B05.10]|uniref:Uncharacterized protein n=1 Tax=Botryotinia fuckeliana (strain B05.10) TaxID=332648 RepID=A0A384JPN0_BOTFB|nr:hypothetical protein BCIN_08g02320 [Botrytis cinerea B05.10]ATZ52548.1 hypothetical protein BCIN_08g02320 [Botrytis cinerea B05.10]
MPLLKTTSSSFPPPLAGTRDACISPPSKFSPRRCNLTGQNHHRSSVEYCMQRVVIKCERSYIKVRVAREAELHKSLRLRPLMNIHIPVTKCLGYPILLYRTERAIERPYRNPQPRENA